MHTRYCYRHDSKLLLNHAKKPLARITLADLQSLAASLASSGLAPISRARTLPAVKSLFGFCYSQRYIKVNPAAELPLPSYENRLAERILGEEDVGRMLAAETSPRDKTLLRLEGRPDHSETPSGEYRGGVVLGPHSTPFRTDTVCNSINVKRAIGMVPTDKTLPWHVRMAEALRVYAGS